MPELPEVETIKIQLQKYIVGEKIESVEVKNKKIFSGNPDDLVGSKITSIERYAKVLSINLSGKLSILVHVKLTGQLIYRGKKLRHKPLSKKVTGGVPGPHTHFVFHLSNGDLYYNDVRRFGWVRVVKTKDIKNEKFVGNLGPEPLKNLKIDYFKNLLQKSRRSIKVLLMDQSKIGGVGNIYANDALWLAKINPKRPASSLNGKEINTLFKAIERVLKDGLRYNGASELAFVTPDGSEGEYQDHTLVYGRDGKPCKRCKKEKIKKFFLGGRGTYWCERCQG